jgi:hypothetical protein
VSKLPHLRILAGFYPQVVKNDRLFFKHLWLAFDTSSFVRLFQFLPPTYAFATKSSN